VPGSTSVLALPYPVTSDPCDPQADIQALANALDGKLGISKFFDELKGSAASTIDITSIPQTRTHLLLLMSARSAAAVDNSEMFMQFNLDSAAVYDYERMWATTTGSGSASEAFAQAGSHITAVPGGNATASSFGAMAVLIPDYRNTVGNHASVSIAGGLLSVGGAAMIVEADIQNYRTAGAITRITCTLTSAQNFAAGTRTTLYGIA